jgi:hypothetical protein
MTFVLCLSLWILQATHEEIAKLIYHACGIEKKPDTKSVGVDFVRLGVFAEISAWMFQFETNGLLVALSSISLAVKIYKQQKEFASLDRSAKPRKGKLYIDGAGPSQSAWANDPKVLQYIPRFINSRHLTCMTLAEVAFLLYATNAHPEDGAFFMAVTMGCHYVTDALDGGLGRYRKEGYVFWGGYTDHLFDAIYESACMLALWMMMRHESATSSFTKMPLLSPSFGPLCLILMNIFVWAFHSKETISCKKKLAAHYSNLVGPIPLHYIEWFCIAYLLLMHFAGFSPTWNACLVILWLCGGIFALALWHVNVRKAEMMKVK